MKRLIGLAAPAAKPTGCSDSPNHDGIAATKRAGSSDFIDKLDWPLREWREN